MDPKSESVIGHWAPTTGVSAHSLNFQRVYSTILYFVFFFYFFVSFNFLGICAAARDGNITERKRTIRN